MTCGEDCEAPCLRFDQKQARPSLQNMEQTSTFRSHPDTFAQLDIRPLDVLCHASALHWDSFFSMGPGHISRL